ncbi:MAG: biotin--[acetyl-CoA-carboxylase] ligase [Deltaproteobacteria bacterium]|nr:biotin--[acetyl-CoA-carboxylase] ligase [Deltaproteobacteria bacterium]
MHDSLRPEVLSRDLADTLFSSHIHYHPTIDSTNRFARDLALAGEAEGALVVAEKQTQGRGRRGRSWLSPGKGNLFFSVLLRPDLTPQRVFSLTMILALAAMEAVKSLSGLLPRIKWPNDLYGGTKKLGGILTEFCVTHGAVDWVVLGLGLNVNFCPEELAGLATSILDETGIKVSRNELLVDIVKGMGTAYQEILSGNFEPYYKRWNEACFILGKAVIIESERGRIYGKAFRIEPDGALIVETREGELRRVVAGDVSLRLSS